MSPSDTPAVSSSLSLETLARLARGLIATRLTKEICDRSQAYASASSCERVEAALLADFIAECTPERILGLIDAAQQQQKQDQLHSGTTMKNQPQEPKPSRDATWRALARSCIEAYVQHHDGCAFTVAPKWTQCTCGLHDVVTELAATEPRAGGTVQHTPRDDAAAHAEIAAQQYSVCGRCWPSLCDREGAIACAALRAEKAAKENPDAR